MQGDKMKIKTRLIIAFFSLVLIPIILVAAIGSMVLNYQSNYFKSVYGVSGDYAMFTSTSVKVLAQLTEVECGSILKTTIEEPEKLENTEYLDEVNRRLKKRYSYMIVCKDSEIIYNGASTKDIQLVADELPIDVESLAFRSNESYYNSEKGYLRRGIDFTFSSGERGKVFLITIEHNVVQEGKYMFIQILIAIILILMITEFGLIGWIYRSIVSPLRKLTSATHHIKEGNLEFTLDVDKEDEIGSLFKDFDEMRLRLKDSAEEKIQYDNDSKVLISNISHDLKTPITAIKGYVEGIMDGVADSPEKIERYIKTIYNKANDMDRLIDELTYYSKIDTNRVPYVYSKIDIGEFFLDCTQEVGLDLESKGMELKYTNNLSPGVLVVADAEQFKKVINNIINNSVKYMPKDRYGRVVITLKEEGDFVHIEMEDNGMGISRKDMPHIFDRLYRSDESRNSRKGGSGIGLSIVKKIIEDHGGRIWATSKENEGTKMHIVIRKYKEETKNENSNH